MINYSRKRNSIRTIDVRMIHVFLSGLLSAVDMTQSTSSSHWREQGNGIYVTARDNLCPSVRKERLRQAASCYYKAFNFSVNEDEKVIVAKKKHDKCLTKRVRNRE